MADSNTSAPSQPIFEPFSWHADDEKAPENRFAHVDVRRLEEVEDILRGNALFIGLLEHDTWFADVPRRDLEPFHRGQLFRLLVSTNTVMAEVLSEDRDSLRRRHRGSRRGGKRGRSARLRGQALRSSCRSTTSPIGRRSSRRRMSGRTGGLVRCSDRTIEASVTTISSSPRSVTSGTFASSRQRTHASSIACR